MAQGTGGININLDFGARRRRKRQEEQQRLQRANELTLKFDQMGFDREESGRSVDTFMQTGRVVLPERPIQPLLTPTSEGFLRPVEFETGGEVPATEKSSIFKFGQERLRETPEEKEESKIRQEQRQASRTVQKEERKGQRDILNQFFETQANLFPNQTLADIPDELTRSAVEAAESLGFKTATEIIPFTEGEGRGQISGERKIEIPTLRRLKKKEKKEEEVVSFKTEEEAQKALDEGKIKTGDIIRIGGRRFKARK